ncbi:hypothetical protein F5X98DRAFT_372110 [Xylaria grammica]|nr:hypothetical protein F5X98DRAFT_372110 [Xylaria grammica]
MGRQKLPELPIVGNQRKWNVIKVVLRSLCLTLSIADIAELVAVDYSPSDLEYWPTVAYPILSVFILWDVVEFVVIIARGSVAKGVHPGAHVGVELILWLGTIFTVTSQALSADWGQLAGFTTSPTWAYVALTQFIILSLLGVLRFVFFVRACVEVDRRKKDRRLQQLVFAIQEQGRDPQAVPLAAFKKARELDHVSSSTVLRALSRSTSTTATMDSAAARTSHSSTVPGTPRSSPEERDFAYKYNFPIATVPELLESGVHPEDARNQKVLIGAFPR